MNGKPTSEAWEEARTADGDDKSDKDGQAEGSEITEEDLQTTQGACRDR